MNKTPLSKQLGYWQGTFGNAYTARNSDMSLFAKRKPFFKKILAQLSDVHSILEVGPNIGANLANIHEIDPTLQLSGYEPNLKAASTAQQNLSFAKIVQKSSLELDETDTYDLVFSCGVLIHIADHELTTTLKNMHRASKKYLLVIEYYSPRKEDIPYRGLRQALFKRPYDKEVKKLFPNICLLDNGFVDTTQGFDNCHWWLFQK